MRNVANIQTPERSEFMPPVLPTFPDLSRRTVLVGGGATALGEQQHDASKGGDPGFLARLVRIGIVST